MPTEIHQDDVGKLVEQGAALVEVLPRDKYEREHLPGAISIPLSRLNRASTAELEPDRPVIVYCHDHQ
jgi:rhodanese-related sulfurtransferase